MVMRTLLLPGIGLLTVWVESGIIATHTMRRSMYLKYISWALLTVILSVTLLCVHDNAHAKQHQTIATAISAVHTELSSIQHCPCSPLEHDNDCDECDSCVDCACHAPVTIHQFQFSHHPIMALLTMIDPFKHLPEVFLTKFIPPHIKA